MFKQKKEESNEKRGEKKEKKKKIRVDSKKIQEQRSIKIEGIDVYFPYEAYPLQVDYMKTVILALENKQNALLQSPTGTGKTLCLLCASLAWLKNKREKEGDSYTGPDTRIVYSSRTHTQIEQVVKELKNTVYRPSVAVLASRDFYCIKKEFSGYKGNVLNIECNKAKLSRDYQNTTSCSYYQRLTNDFDNIKLRNENKMMDIEDLKGEAKQDRYCPFYFSQKNKNNSDIVFMPYNYLLDSKINSVYRLELEDSILIFDEAHNVEGVTEESSGFTMNQNDLKEAVKELENLQKKIGQEKAQIHEMFLKSNMTNVEDILRLLRRVEDNFNRVHDEYYKSTLYQGMKTEKAMEGEGHTNVMEGEGVFSLMDRLLGNTDGKVQTTLLGTKDDLSPLNSTYVHLLSQAEEDMVTMNKSNFQKYSNFMIQVNDLTNRRHQYTMAEPGQVINNNVSHYKLSIYKEKEEREIAMWCFSPSVQFSNLMGQEVRSVLLTSGTLSPFESFESELKIPFQLQLSNKHIVAKKNIQAMVVKQGVNKTGFDFSFKNRSNRAMLIDVGETLLKFIERIPNGVLVFFSSYSILDQCYKVWLDSQLIQRMERFKAVVKEPKSSRELEGLMKMFKAKAAEGGAILFAVCKGKVAEGIDFSDELCRAVFMLGIPYAPMRDPKVIHKQRYLDFMKSQSDKNQHLSGNQWYQMQAIRATNQAIGRVIRHLNDHGAIIFMDQRFSYKNNLNNISGWIREVTQNYDEFGPAYRAIIQFFKQFQHKQTFIPFNLKQPCEQDDKPVQQNRKPVQFNAINKNVNQQLNKYINKSDSDDEFTKIDITQYKPERARLGNDDSQSSINQNEEKNMSCCSNLINYLDQKEQFRIKKPIIKPMNTLSESFKLNKTQLNVNQQKEDIKFSQISEDDCIICLAKYEDNGLFMKSKCNHICCKSCWDQTLSYKFECPMCRRKVRQVQLQRI